MAHYPPLRGASITDFFKASLEFTSNMDIALLDILQSAKKPLPLKALLEAIDARLGPFEVNIQWIGPTLAHLNRHVAQGLVRMEITDDIRTWQAN